VLGSLLARRAVESQFQLYVDNNNRRQTTALAQVLSRYYERNGSWDEVESVLHDPLPRLSSSGNRNQPRPSGHDLWEAMGARALIVNNDGIVVADSAQEMEGEEINTATMRLGSPIRVGDVQVGTAIVAAATDSSAAQTAFLRQMNRVLFMAVAIAGGIALLLGAVLTWGMIRPLHKLRTAVNAVAHGDLSQRVQTRANDEIGDLADAFNQMSTQLDRSETSRRQMTADIAHELRTPLTVIQGNVEALQDGIFPLTLDALDPIADKTKLLTRLVEDLRQLALAEAGELHLDREETAVCALAERLINSFQPMAAAAEVNITVVPSPTLPNVNVDSQRLQQVFNNLLSNAIRHTPAGGTVTIGCQPDGATIRISIADTGDGVPADKLPYLFERFYRVDDGRGRGDGSGIGLGLAVAKSIVEAHGGVIGAKNGADGGAIFWFTLPL
jgi:signal transduction histidine kinase